MDSLGTTVDAPVAEPQVETPTKAVLSRDAILASQDIQTEEVSIPEWGGVVYVRGLTGKERDQFELSMVQGKGKSQELNLKNFRAKLIVLSVVDGPNSTTRLFTPADVVALGEKSASALQEVFKVAQRLSGLNQADVEELTLSLGEGQSADSGSA